jgi:hypothetical protein
MSVSSPDQYEVHQTLGEREEERQQLKQERLIRQKKRAEVQAQRSLRDQFEQAKIKEAMEMAENQLKIDNQIEKEMEENRIKFESILNNLSTSFDQKQKDDMIEKGASLARLEERVNFIRRILHKTEIELEEYYTFPANFVDAEEIKLREENARKLREEARKLREVLEEKAKIELIKAYITDNEIGDGEDGRFSTSWKDYYLFIHDKPKLVDGYKKSIEERLQLTAGVDWPSVVDDGKNSVYVENEKLRQEVFDLLVAKKGNVRMVLRLNNRLNVMDKDPIKKALFIGDADFNKSDETINTWHGLRLKRTGTNEKTFDLFLKKKCAPKSECNAWVAERMKFERIFTTENPRVGRVGARLHLDGFIHLKVLAGVEVVVRNERLEDWPGVVEVVVRRILRSLGVPVQVAPFQSKGLKPVFHFTGSKGALSHAAGEPGAPGGVVRVAVVQRDPCAAVQGRRGGHRPVAVPGWLICPVRKVLDYLCPTPAWGMHLVRRTYVIGFTGSPRRGAAAASWWW